jgi:hypothetical protein
MDRFCKNHSNVKALSFCHSCKEYFCENCLEESIEYYYCKKKSCQEAKRREAVAHDEVDKSKGSDTPKILIDGKAVGFCEKCMGETNSESISKGFSIRNAIIINEREPCEVCGSVIMDLKKKLPIIPFIWRNVGSYRIIKTWDLDPDALFLHRNKFISRKLK